jgi:vesicle-associated membrane protein 7
MEIIYSVIARGTDIIAEYPTGKREMKQIVSLVLSHLPAQDHKRTLEHAPVNIHYHQNRPNRDQNFVVLCVTHQDFSFRVSYKFIEDVSKTYRERFLTSGNADPNRKLVRQYLKDTMKSYKQNDRDKYNRLKKDLAVTKNAMMDNVDKILQRAEKLETLQDRTNDLSMGSMEFRSKSSKLKNSMCMENYKLIVILVVVVIVIIISGVWVGCKFPTFERCLPSKNNSDSNTTK